MKRYFSIAVFILLSAQLFAQKSSTEDLVKAMRGGRLSMEADKSILSSGEVAQLNVDIFIPPNIDSHTGEPTNEAQNVKASDAARTLASAGVPFFYKAQNWKIIQGGGSMDIIDDFNIKYMAPSQAPRDNIIVISVDLIPTGHDMPKVVLLKTLYFQDRDNVFAFNVPGSGINDVRYSQKTTGASGAAAKLTGVTAIDPRALAGMPAADRKRLEAAAAQVKAAQRASDINVVSLTSNANAIFDPANNVTVIKFIGLGRDRGPGQPTAAGSGILMITYTGGLTKGVHPFNGTLNAIGFNPDGPPTVKTCACAMQGNPRLQKLKCSGTLTITSMDGDFIKGTISSTIWNNKTGVDKTFNRGTVYGVFKVRKAYKYKS